MLSWGLIVEGVASFSPVVLESMSFFHDRCVLGSGNSGDSGLPPNANFRTLFPFQAPAQGINSLLEAALPGADGEHVDEQNDPDGTISGKKIAHRLSS